MLPSDHRMRRRDDFRVAVRTGVRAAGPTLVVHLAPGRGEGPVRIGLVVNRSVGAAVVRNTVRRRLRALLHQRLDRVPAGARVVVRALPEAAGASSRRLGVDLDAAMRRAVRRAGPEATAGVGR